MVALKLFRYFFGFVRVKATGLYPERIINLCYKNNITVWLIRKKEDALYFNIAAKDFKALKKIRSKSGISLKIKYKIGLWFLIKRHNDRIGVLVGLVILFAFLNLLSSYVWNIDVVGNTNLSKEEILTAAKEIGIYEGMKKSSIDSPVMRNTMLISYDKLSWVSFNLEGSLLTINVSETRQVEKQDDNIPSNLVAAKDGVIKHIEIKNGYAAVKVGEAVKKGDLLVSGVQEFKDGVSSFFASNGMVLAETEITVKKTVPLKCEQYVYSGKSRVKNVLSFFGLKIPLYLGSVKGEYDKTISEHYIKTKNNYLPIKIIRAKFDEKVKATVTKTEEEAKKELVALAENELQNDKIKKITDVKDSFVLKDNKLTIIRKATVLEDITIKKEIQFSDIS